MLVLGINCCLSPANDDYLPRALRGRKVGETTIIGLVILVQASVLASPKPTGRKLGAARLRAVAPHRDE